MQSSIGLLKLIITPFLFYFSMQNLDEDDENAETRPNKLFPVKNERDVLLRKVRRSLYLDYLTIIN